MPQHPWCSFQRRLLVILAFGLLFLRLTSFPDANCFPHNDQCIICMPPLQNQQNSPNLSLPTSLYISVDQTLTRSAACSEWMRTPASFWLKHSLIWGHKDPRCAFLVWNSDWFHRLQSVEGLTHHTWSSEDLDDWGGVAIVVSSRGSVFEEP